MDKSLKIALILAASDRMSATINRAFSNAEKKTQNLQKMSERISNAGDKALLAGGVGAGFFGATLKAAADMERMQVALRTSFQGNEAAAKQAFGIINKFAAKTPYELGEVMTGFIKLKNMGLDPSQEALTAYGNTASAMGKSLNDMVEAVADAATGEFERLKEFGIKASSQGNKVAFMFQGVKTVVNKDSKSIENYLKTLGNTKFAGGIEAQSKTLYGKLSTLKDNAVMVAAKVGNVLVPAINSLFDRISPVLAKVEAFVQQHPGVVKFLAAATVGLLGLGVAMKVAAFWMAFSGKVMTGVSFVMKLLQGNAAVTTAAMHGLKTAMLSTGILLIVAAIAAAAYLIYKNWGGIKAWFSRLWEGVKSVFAAVWKWIKKIFWDYQPAVLIYNNWNKITGFFSGLWERVKGVFTGFFKWFVNLHAMFFNAGANIAKSIWQGIKSMANKPVQAIKDIVQKVRNMLPFSPAKDGPLKDIHRIKLVETIASSINAKPLLNAWQNVTSQLRGQVGQAIPAFGGAGGGTTIHFSPTIHLSGSATPQDGDMMILRMRKEFNKMMDDYNRSKGRVSF